MNWNAIKTLLLGSGIIATAGPAVINWLTTLAGCVGDDPATAAIEVAQCTGGGLFTISPTFQKIVGGIVMTAAIAGTAWFKSGTWAQNLFSKSVPVVSFDKSGPGTVVQSDVDRP